MGTRVAGRRTWVHRPPDAWRPLFVLREACGCWVDHYSEPQMWEPCVAHEGEGHVAAISEDPDTGLSVVRCLVVVCPWGSSWASEAQAFEAARVHWEETRSTT